MSYFHANLIWQSKDGTWNAGFYKRVPGYGAISDPDYGYDPEWDDEYTDEFEFVARGYSNSSEAMDQWHGANPGSFTLVPYNDRAKQVIESAEEAAAIATIAAKRRYSGVKVKKAFPSTSFDRARAALRTVEAKHKDFLNYGNELELEEAVHNFDINANQSEITADQRTYLKALREEVLKTVAREAKALRRKGNERQIANSEKLLKELEKLKGVTVTATKANNIAAAERALARNAPPKFHVNPKTGRTGQCKAYVKGCPFGGGEAHFSTRELAQKAYEASQDTF